MNIFGNISIEEFLSEYWQKKPLLIRNAFPNYESPIEPDDLAGLSMEDDAESRLIFENGPNTKWELQHGPFSEDDFAKLPDSKWTLLVQAVDQWVPELADLLESFNFLPRWRLDDIMASFAPKGGSVGPHFDQYDVFLLQAHGQRHWQIGPKYTDNAQFIEDTDLKILKNMEVAEEWTLNPGDMLYVPPQYAHNGVAVDDCMTFSVGFRAPSEADILSHYTDHQSFRLTESERFKDQNLANCQSKSALIGDNAIEALKEILNKHLSDTDSLKSWFAQHMTESKYDGLHEPLEDALEWDEIAPFFAQDHLLTQNETTRWAYFYDSYGTQLVINGAQVEVENSATCNDLVELLANNRRTPTRALDQYLQDPHCQQLLLNLINFNYLYFDEE